MRAISPLTAQKPKGRKQAVKDDSYSEESDSFASEEEEEGDDDDETQAQSLSSSEEKSKTSEQEEEEDSYENSASSSEYEFGGDDEEFMPDDEDDDDDDDESAAMSEFIVDDASEEKIYRNYAKKSKAKSKSVNDEDDIFNATNSTRSAAKSERSEHEDSDSDSEDDDCVGTECADFTFGDDNTKDVDDNDDDDNNTEMVEETPSKPTRRTLEFESPEMQLAMIVDDDEDNDDGDVLFATIVNADSVDGDTVVLTFDEDQESNKENCEAINVQKTPPSKNNSYDKASQKLLSSSSSIELENRNVKFNNIEENKNQRNSPEKVDAKPPLSAKKKKKKSQKKYRQEGEVKRGKWALGAKIGVGSFGTVHVGMNKKTGVLMAVKKFKMEGAIMEDIKTEVELMRSLEHTNIVRYLGAQMDDEYLHIFQEWVPGGSVASLLSKFGAFSIEVIQSYISQTLEGLNYLHDNNIMHRDIKGSNILVNDEGVVKLADFGASKKLKNLASNMMMSMTVRGTPYFMAPEVFEEKYSAKADIWGIGCVVFQMVTASPPWKGLGFTNPISLFNHIKKHKGSPPMEHPEKESFSKRDESLWVLLEQFVDKCFEQDPSKRPSVQELLNDPFITATSHDDDESTDYRGLFSPGAESKTLFSPKKLSSSSKRRSKSSVSREATLLCLSPPQTKSNRSLTKTQTPPAKATAHKSPSPDTSGWPAWAKTQLHKESKDTKISQLLDSLALSEDSSDVVGGRRSSATNLVGLNFLESTGSNSTK